MADQRITEVTERFRDVLANRMLLEHAEWVHKHDPAAYSTDSLYDESKVALQEIEDIACLIGFETQTFNMSGAFPYREIAQFVSDVEQDCRAMVLLEADQINFKLPPGLEISLKLYAPTNRSQVLFERDMASLRAPFVSLADTGYPIDSLDLETLIHQAMGFKPDIVDKDSDEYPLVVEAAATAYGIVQASRFADASQKGSLTGRDTLETVADPRHIL